VKPEFRQYQSLPKPNEGACRKASYLPTLSKSPVFNITVNIEIVRVIAGTARTSTSERPDPETPPPKRVNFTITI